MGIINNQGVFIAPPLGPGGATALTSFREDDDFSTELFDESIVLPSLPNNVGIAFIKSSDSPADFATISLDGTNTSTIFVDNTIGICSFAISNDVFVGYTTGVAGIPVANGVNGNLYVNNHVNITGVTTSSGGFVGNLTGTASGNKLLSSFDIPHAKQKGKRIRHIIAEGPEPGIYVRGKIKDTNVIELPEYWDGLIDPETITVTLTQIGYSQDLIVDKIDLGKNIIIRSGVGTNIHCYYEVWASRWINPMNHDEKLIVVYDGETPDDYPGDNKQFLIGGWDYDRRNTYWKPLDTST